VYKNTEIRGYKQYLPCTRIHSANFRRFLITDVPNGFSLPTYLFSSMDFTGTFHCSFCGEENEIFVEPEDGKEQTITEDCSVCCRPNVLTIRIIGEQIIIDSEFEG